jgi:hypothetical protein
MDNKDCSTGTTCSTGTGGADGSKKCCWGTLIKGGLAGGVSMFVYFTASLTQLPWNKTIMTNVMNDGRLTPCLIKSFLMCLVASLLLTKVVKKCAAAGCCPVFSSLIIGVMVAIFSYVPNMIWYQSPIKFAWTGMFDQVLAITLAGLVISKFVLKKGACGPAKCDDKKTGCGS